jgi:hypothetical protein
MQQTPPKYWHRTTQRQISEHCSNVIVHAVVAVCQAEPEFLNIVLLNVLVQQPVPRLRCIKFVTAHT